MKKRFSKLAALLLASALVLTQPTGAFASASINATEGAAATASEQTSGNGTVSETKTVSAEEETAPEAETAVSSDSGSTGTDQIIKASENAAAETVSVESASGDARIASTAQICASNELYSQVNELAGLTPGVDYVADEAYFMTDSTKYAEQVAKEYGAELESCYSGVAVIKFNNSTTLTEELLSIASECSVNEAVYPNLMYEIDETKAVNDPMYNDTYQWFHSSISSAEAWNTTQGEGVTVAVIDTGVRTDHVDLKDNVVGGVNVVNKTLTQDYEDDYGHGTNVAGIIAEEANNGILGAGVAPKAKLYIIKCNVGKSISAGAELRGINEAVKYGVDVINMSLGGEDYDQNIQDAINAAVKKGITVVASAGNSGVNTKSYPAAYDNVIAVAAYDNNNKLASFSNYGDWVDIAAPGDSITSCGMGSSTGLSTYRGTSQASPMVAATCALIYSSRPELIKNNSASSVTEVTNILMRARRQKEYSYNGHSVKGGVDAGEAAKVLKLAITAQNEVQSGKTIEGGEDRSIQLSANIADAEIYYTTDGTTPNNLSSHNKGSVSVSLAGKTGKITVKAFAMYGSGMTEIQTFTRKIVVYVRSVSLNEGNNICIAPGKSVTVGGVPYPSYATNKKIMWTKSAGDDAISVTSSGTIKCKKTATVGAKCVINARAADGQGGTSVSVNVTVVNPSTTIAITNAPEKILLATKAVNSMPVNFRLQVTSDGQQLFRYKSSNTKVAAVKNGLITAAGRGSATITVMTIDGSNKKATCRVSVTAPVTDIDYKYSNGLPSKTTDIAIGAGRSIKITAKALADEAYGKLASNTKLNWSVTSGSGGSVKNGTVKCDRDTAAKTTFTVKCEPYDGYGLVSKEFRFTVYPQATKMTISSSSATKRSTSVYVPMSIGDTITQEQIEKSIEVTPDDAYKGDYQWIVPKNMEKYFNIIYGDDGNPSSIMAKQKKNMTVTIKMRDGSGKSVKVQFRAK